MTTEQMGLILDAILMITIACLAIWAVCTISDHKSAILFIGFGLLLSLTWMRLRAPDVALAEAAVGAGATGALLTGYLSRPSRKTDRTNRPTGGRRIPRFTVVFLIAFTALYSALSVASKGAPDAGRMVAENIGDSGVSNPVTAVLLNFRGYDTLIEIAVLFAAALAGGTLLRFPTTPRSRSSSDTLFLALAKSVGPPVILLSGYLLWIGASAPGGAFQAGALLAGLAALLILSGVVRQLDVGNRLVRFLLGAGLGVFCIAAAGGILIEGELLKYPVTTAKWWILAIETAATVSIVVALAALLSSVFPSTPTEDNKESR